MARKLTGTLTSLAGTHTVAVTVTEHRRHSKYKKPVVHSSTFLAHYEGAPLEIGSAVSIEETRPMSARKTWKVVS